MKSEFQAGDYILGLDVGVNSVGWALVTLDNGQLAGLTRAGVRVFAAGVEGDVATGRDESRAAKRREARSRRRMLERSRRRLDKLALLLQQAGLLPPGDLSSPHARTRFFTDLDRSLFPQAPRGTDAHVQLYRMRARALDERLEPHELGRALYHLAQRRGFLSSRRFRPGREDREKEEGEVKQEIGKLAESMHKAGARTLGEYFSGLDPTQERIRSRWTGRPMYQDEFEAIWTAQAPHYPQVLTDELKKRVHHAIFFQRPLKLRPDRVGQCELEPNCKRAPFALLAAQRFRLLQKVNDLEVTTPDGPRRKLTPQERQTLLDALEAQGDLKFGRIRNLLKLRRHTFNFERDGEDRLIGNRTASKLVEVFGKRWKELSSEEKDQVVEDVRSIQDREALKRRAMRRWGLDEKGAAELAEVALEDGYCHLSRKALAKILPLLEQGKSYATARKEVYGEQPPAEAVDILPPVADALDVRNPAVERALTEVRKVVNALVREHGKPASIRIELARDLKKTRKDRQQIASRNWENRKAREQARGKLQEYGIPNPKRRDIEKLLLWNECRRQCPYTGQMICMDALFGPSPQFDVEHIIPLHRCLDNSFINKTLCDNEENRNRKRNQTPWEAYGSDDARWSEIIERVKRFQGTAGTAKLERFQMQEVESLDDYTSRQLNDTRYASRLAVQYVGTLYGAGADGVDPADTTRVQAGRGQVTQHLRNEWELNRILGGGEKRRDDHRHHAIDAVVVALTEPATVKMLSDAAKRAPSERRRRGRTAPLDPPWPGFLDDVRSVVENIIVSHRTSRKVVAALHEETIYSKPHKDPEGRECHHIRKPLGDPKRGLSKRDLEHIVDPVVREAIMAKLRELRRDDPKTAFKDRSTHPRLRTKDGRQIPIHSVRVRCYDATTPIGEGARQRWVILGSNHHIEILETKDAKGRSRWKGEVVSTYEAMRRLRADEPIVQREHGPGKNFLFSLAAGEIIEIDGEADCARALYVVKKVTRRRGDKGERVTVGIAHINDARASSERDLQELSPEVLRRRRCEKVVVTPLGEVRSAHD